MMILRKKKQIMRRLGRSLLLRILLNTRILVSNTTKRCLHIARGLVNAAIPCKARLLTQSPASALTQSTLWLHYSAGSYESNLLTQSAPALLRGSLDNAEPSCEDILIPSRVAPVPARIVVDADLSCEVALVDAAPPCEASLDNAEPILRGSLVDAAPPCEDYC